ncbi:MAG TPA: hypothetical protein VFF04_05500 [Candidatus Babeliales bacterium]|nr:hypothetical protein [Candidatus Babeliales bacterium]
MYRGSPSLLLMVMSISCLSYCAERRANVKRPISTSQSEESAKDSQEGKVRYCERITNGIVGALCAISVVALGAKSKADSDQTQEKLTAICDNPSSVNGFTLNSPMAIPKISGNAGICLTLKMVDCNQQARYVSEIVGPFCGNIKYTLQPLSKDQKKALHEKMNSAVSSSSGKHIFYWHRHDRLYGFSEGM